MAETTTLAAPALADLCSDLLAFTLQLRKSPDPGDADALRQKIDEQFRALEVKARQADIPAEDVLQAKYAIAAFVDEIVLSSSWPAKESWADRPLQLAYFNDFAAGEEFYNRIDALRGAKKNAVLEVYYLCLTLGFRGKYVDLQGMEKKKVLMDTLLREVRPPQPAGGGGLSPAWQAADTIAGLTRGLPAWFVAVACTFGVVVLFVLLSSLLGWTVDGVLQQLK